MIRNGELVQVERNCVAEPMGNKYNRGKLTVCPECHELHKRRSTNKDPDLCGRCAKRKARQQKGIQKVLHEKSQQVRA